MRQYVVDAFADRVFQGNPAAVCPMEGWPREELLLQIARENCLPATAFLVREGADWGLRWFGPGGEMDLCGHATLAAAYVVFTRLRREQDQVTFHTKGGPLTVRRRGELLESRLPPQAPGGHRSDRGCPGGPTQGGVAGPGSGVRL